MDQDRIPEPRLEPPRESPPTLEERADAFTPCPIHGDDCVEIDEEGWLYCAGKVVCTGLKHAEQGPQDCPWSSSYISASSILKDPAPRCENGACFAELVDYSEEERYRRAYERTFRVYERMSGLLTTAITNLRMNEHSAGSTWIASRLSDEQDKIRQEVPYEPA